MLYLNIQPKKHKPAIIAAAVILALFTAACAVSLSVSRQISATATRDEAGEYSLTVKNDEQAKAFLQGFGIEKVIEKTGREKVIIPKSFNSVYENYNEIQKRVGLDLSRYKGKSALKVTYKIESEKAGYAVLLLYKNRVIGGHLTSPGDGRGYLPLA